MENERSDLSSCEESVIYKLADYGKQAIQRLLVASRAYSLEWKDRPLEGRGLGITGLIAMRNQRLPQVCRMFSSSPRLYAWMSWKFSSLKQFKKKKTTNDLVCMRRLNRDLHITHQGWDVIEFWKKIWTGIGIDPPTFSKSKFHIAPGGTHPIKLIENSDFQFQRIIEQINFKISEISSMSARNSTSL